MRQDCLKSGLDVHLAVFAWQNRRLVGALLSIVVQLAQPHDRPRCNLRTSSWSNFQLQSSPSGEALPMLRSSQPRSKATALPELLASGSRGSIGNQDHLDRLDRLYKHRCAIRISDP